MDRVWGVPTASFGNYIRTALVNYSDMTAGRVLFDADTAAVLELSSEGRYSARSVSTVKHLGEAAATLTVIAFGFADGTGSESEEYKLTDNLQAGNYPLKPKVIPRRKTVHSEAHLAMFSQFPRQPYENPIMFAGNLDLIGFNNGKLGRLAHLGQSLADFIDATQHHTPARPTVTLTTGFHQSNGERFGDPHAVFNPHFSLLQVCGFIAITHEMASQHADMLSELGAVEPTLLF